MVFDQLWSWHFQSLHIIWLNCVEGLRKNAVVINRSVVKYLIHIWSNSGSSVLFGTALVIAFCVCSAAIWWEGGASGGVGGCSVESCQ